MSTIDQNDSSEIEIAIFSVLNPGQGRFCPSRGPGLSQGGGGGGGGGVSKSVQ